ncbi:MAG: cytochrome ubiquinol oxidase subunit I [Acidimicrobiales bacterium]
MNAEGLARWQFGITTVYHFLMVPLTIGLSLVVAWFQTRWYRTGDDAYLRLTKFFGKLFLINFAMGVVTGIVQEFQFGMNWANYSRFVGDVFGAPLAMEALVAFFLESTFLGLWIFGWGRLSKKVHLMTIWAAAIGTTLSAYFIIAANSWMQHPVGVRFNPTTGRAEMTDVWAVLTNPTTLAAYPHVIFGALMTAAVFVGGISAWLLLKQSTVLGNPDLVALRRSLRGAIWLTFFAGAAVAVSGHFQTRMMFEQQPMKMAAAEALCSTEKGPGLSILAIGDVSAECDVRSFVIPQALSLLATDKTGSTIEGVKDINARYQELYGPGDYRPNLIVTYWGFRLMIGFGVVAATGAAAALWFTRKGKVPPPWRWLPAATIAVVFTPFLANSFGWIFTEMGRQPWVVAPNPNGLPEVRLLTANAVSPSVAGWTVLVSLVGFTLVYGFLAIIEMKLLVRYVKAGPHAVMPIGHDESQDHGDDDAGRASETSEGDTLAFAY